MNVQRIEYIIRPDGTVEEKVEGVPGPTCEQITMAFEDNLGEVVERTHTAEYVLRPTPTPSPVTEQAKARSEQAPA